MFIGTTSFEGELEGMSSRLTGSARLRAARDGNAVGLNFLSEGVAVHPEQLRGLNLVAARFSKRVSDQRPFDCLDDGRV